MAGSRSIGNIFASLSIRDQNFSSGIKNASANLSELGKSAAGIGGKLAGAFAAVGVTAGIVGFAKSSSNAAASLEDLAIQFEVLTGSAAKSQELLKAFREEEKKSALSTEDYAKAAKSILAFGGSAESIMPILKQIGDISMGNSERFGSLALAFAQTTAAGRLMGQEVLQFVNAGFNPLEQISRDTGKSMADLKKQMEAGGISVDMVKTAFINATSAGGRFYKAIEKGSAGTNAKLNQTAATMTQLKVAFGTGFNDGLKDALDAINNSSSSLVSTFTKAGEWAGGFISLISDGAMWEIFALKAQMAFAEILESPGLKQLTQIPMLIQGVSWDMSSKIIGGGLADSLQGRIDAIYDQIAIKADEAGKKEAEARKKEMIASNDPFSEANGGKTIVAPVIEQVAAAVAEPQAMASAEIDNEMIDRKIDDYQRRGLSMSKNPNSVQDKVLKIQEQIRDILKSAKIQGKELVWE